MNTERDRNDSLTLEILDVINRQKDVSQRHLARHLGVALGLTNSYLKRCIRKGLIKVSQAPANRYLYYLTPKGFAEKSRLTAQYLSISFGFYHRAGDSCRQEFERCKRNGWHRLLLCGLSDLAEIATVRAMEHDITIIGYHDPASDKTRFLSRPVWRQLDQAEGYDACMLTELQSPLASYQHLQKQMASDRILVPDVLRIEKHSL
jgi:DNA-binding MarR family transcriptional regulator